MVSVTPVILYVIRMVGNDDGLFYSLVCFLQVLVDIWFKDF